MADITSLDLLNQTQIELLQKYDGALNRFNEINNYFEDGKAIEAINAENALKLGGLQATEFADNALNNVENSVIINKLSKSGTFTATLNGVYGNTNTGTAFTKKINGHFHLIGDRVFIEFSDQLINGSEGNEIVVKSISDLPFIAKESSFNGTVYGRGLIFKYSNDIRNYFMRLVWINADSNIINIHCESTTEVYSGFLALRTNDAGSYVRSLSINYQIKE